MESLEVEKEAKKVNEISSTDNKEDSTNADKVDETTAEHRDMETNKDHCTGDKEETKVTSGEGKIQTDMGCQEIDTKDMVTSKKKRMEIWMSRQVRMKERKKQIARLKKSMKQ